MKRLKGLIFIVFISVTMLLISCSTEQSDKQLIGFTIFEKSTPIGISQKTTSLDTIDLNGFFTNNDYSETSFSGNSYFDAKVDYNKLQGDLVSSDSICLFVTANYYQAQSINYKLFLYDIYLLDDGTYQLEYNKDIELPQNVGSNEVITVNYESKKKSINYVFTYKLTIKKIANPLETIIREFATNNVILKESIINSEYSNYEMLPNTEYAIVTEKYKYIDENNEEKIDNNYIFLTKKTDKKTYTFNSLNSHSRMINYIVTFNFSEDNE